jgi:hypothetical protein
MCEFFSGVALDTAGPSPETKRGNMHLLLAIDNYSMLAAQVLWLTALTVVHFLENEVI